MEVFPKYLIIEGKLYLQKCTYHKEILERYLKYNEVEHEKEITPAGGGWFVYKKDLNQMILHGDSTDFGRASLEEVKKCFSSGMVYGNFITEDSIVDEYKFLYMKYDKTLIELN